MATASSTAAPKVRLSSGDSGACALPEKKMTLHSTSVRMNSAAMAIVLIQPRSVMPTSDPHNDQCADDQAPHPAAHVENAVRRPERRHKS